MSDFISYSVELSPTDHQATKFRKNFGARRWAYNYFIDKAKEAHLKGDLFPSLFKTIKELNTVKGTVLLPWGYNVSKYSFEYGLRNCESAFKRFFRTKKGYPKYKTKFDTTQSFTVSGLVYIKDNKIQIPSVGKVKMKETGYIPANCII